MNVMHVKTNWKIDHVCVSVRMCSFWVTDSADDFYIDFLIVRESGSPLSVSVTSGFSFGVFQIVAHNLADFTMCPRSFSEIK